MGSVAAPLDDTSLPIPAAFVRLSFLVQSVYARLAAEHALTPQQAQLLCVVKDQPRGMAELVDILRIDKSSVSGLVDRVERLGLVRRRPSPVDGRAVTVTTTARGRRQGNAFFADVSDELERITTHLRAPERDELAHLVSCVVLAEAVPPVFGAADG